MRLTGRVKWFNSKLGYGFIVSDEVSQDIMVHFSAVMMEGYRELVGGQRVIFELDTTEDGRYRAVQVVPMEPAETKQCPRCGYEFREVS